jgi:hypothetical protein
MSTNEEFPNLTDVEVANSEESKVEKKEEPKLEIRPIEEKKRKNRKKRAKKEGKPKDKPKEKEEKKQASKGWFFARMNYFDTYIPPVFCASKPINTPQMAWFGPYPQFDLARADICVKLQEKLDEIEYALKAMRKLKVISNT